MNVENSSISTSSLYTKRDMTAHGIKPGHSLH